MVGWLLYLEECDDGLRVVVVLVLHGLTGLGLDQQLVDDHTNQSSSTSTSAIGRATFAMPAHACPASADLVCGSDLGLVVDHHAEEGRQVVQLALHVRVQHTDHTRHTSCEVQVCSHTSTPLQQQPKITTLGSFSASTGIYIAASSSPSSPLVALSAAPEHQVLATYARTPPGHRQVDACRSHRGGSKRPVT